MMASTTRRVEVILMSLLKGTLFHELLMQNTMLTIYVATTT